MILERETHECEYKYESFPEDIDEENVSQNPDDIDMDTSVKRCGLA